MANSLILLNKGKKITSLRYSTTLLQSRLCYGQEFSRNFQRKNKSETGQLGQIGHSWAGLKQDRAAAHGIRHTGKNSRFFQRRNKTESGQLGQIGHSWAVLKEKNPFYTFLSFEITSSLCIKKKSLYKSLRLRVS